MRLSLLLLLCALSTGCRPAAAQTPAADPNPALEPIQAFLNAVATSDVDSMVAIFHEDATVFMPSGQVPHRLRGHDDIRKAFAAFLKLRPWPSDARKPDDAQVQQIGDVAIVTFHLGALPGPHDAQATLFSRRTFVVSRNRDGRWLVSHLHASDESVPPPRPKQTPENPLKKG